MIFYVINIIVCIKKKPYIIYMKNVYTLFENISWLERKKFISKAFLHFFLYFFFIVRYIINILHSCTQNEKKLKRCVLGVNIKFIEFWFVLILIYIILKENQNFCI